MVRCRHKDNIMELLWMLCPVFARARFFVAGPAKIFTAEGAEYTEAGTPRGFKRMA
jgi:hypothetical protein